MWVGMQQITDAMGFPRRLEDAVAAPNPTHRDLLLVKHQNSRAYAIVSVPDYMAVAANCQGANRAMI